MNREIVKYTYSLIIMDAKKVEQSEKGPNTNDLTVVVSR